MTTRNTNGSYQSLGKGVYRVGGAVHRSAVTGRYVTKSTSSKSPRTTITERKN